MCTSKHVYFKVKLHILQIKMQSGTGRSARKLPASGKLDEALNLVSRVQI
jgi:hypothetical protein